MAPRKFSGPIQQGAIRVLRDLEVASTSEIMPITHPRQHNPQYRSRSLRRVLDEIAIRVGRAGGQGRPFSGSSSPSFGSRARPLPLDRLLTFLQTNWAARDRTGWHDDAPMRAF